VTYIYSSSEPFKKVDFTSNWNKSHYFPLANATTNLIISILQLEQTLMNNQDLAFVRIP